MFQDLNIFLGAVVADAAARPLHWVYDPKKLKRYIKGKKEIAFLKENKSPFYALETGLTSGYADMGLVMFQTIITSKKKSDILPNFKKNIKRLNGNVRYRATGCTKTRLRPFRTLKKKKGSQEVQKFKKQTDLMRHYHIIF